MTDKLSLSEVLDYCKMNNRVCPKPMYWNTLFEKLPNKEKEYGNFINPSPPLILAAWHFAGDGEKQTRLEEHLHYAESQGVLGEIYVYLKSLDETKWHHSID